MGHIIEDVDEQVVPHNGTDVDLSIDSKIQYIAYTNLKAAVEKFEGEGRRGDGDRRAERARSSRSSIIRPTTRTTGRG